MQRADVIPALRAHASQGAARVRAAWLPTVEAALAAGLAWLFAHYVLGHPQPFFAPVAAWICLGFSHDRDLRSVLELAIGVSLGVGMGDLLTHLIGSGVLQIMGVLVVAALLARFIDRARLVTVQAGVQAIVVVALPATSVNPLGRWTDALTGGVIALIFAALLPHDVRHWPRSAARDTFGELAGVLGELSDAVGNLDAGKAHAALVRARATQPLIDEWSSAQRAAGQLTHVSPTARRHSGELGRLGRALKYGDRAARNIRVICRRAEGLLSLPDAAAALGAEPHVPLAPHDAAAASHGPALAPTIAALGTATQRLGAALAVGADLAPVTREVASAASSLTVISEPGSTQVPADVTALITLLRSMTIDLLQASGAHHKEALALIPPRTLP